jgi:hypothetical protein
MHPPTAFRAPLVAVLTLGLPVGLAACSSSSSSSTTTVASGGGSTTTTATASTKSFSCADAPASAVNAALGTSVGAPETQTNGSVTVCTYHSTSPIQSVIVRVDTSSSSGAFTAGKAQSAAAGEAVTAIAGVGDGAYSLSISGGGFTTNSFVVLKGSTEVQVNGPGTPAQVQSYAVELANNR